MKKGLHLTTRTADYTANPEQFTAEVCGGLTRLVAKVEAKHTPGPWIVSDFADGRPVVMQSEAAAEEFANARLIAAAPEMLAALHEAHAVLAFAKSSGDDGVAEVMAKIEAAIDKSRGAKP